MDFRKFEGAQNELSKLQLTWRAAARFDDRWFMSIFYEQIIELKKIELKKITFRSNYSKNRRIVKRKKKRKNYIINFFLFIHLYVAILNVKPSY